MDISNIDSQNSIVLKSSSSLDGVMIDSNGRMHSFVPIRILEKKTFFEKLIENFQLTLIRVTINQWNL